MQTTRPPPGSASEKVRHSYRESKQIVKRGTRLSKTLVKRCVAFLHESGVPVTKLCARVGMAPSTYYRLIKGQINLSTAKIAAVDHYLNQFGY